MLLSPLQLARLSTRAEYRRSINGPICRKIARIFNPTRSYPEENHHILNVSSKHCERVCVFYAPEHPFGGLNRPQNRSAALIVDVKHARQLRAMPGVMFDSDAGIYDTTNVRVCARASAHVFYVV